MKQHLLSLAHQAKGQLVEWRGRLDRRSESDIREFLPAVLEIIERPPSPMAVIFTRTICAAALAALLWAMIGEVDLVAVARGKVQPVGRVRLVQSFEIGKVLAVHVRDGAQVQEGDILFELEPDEPAADANASRLALASARAEAIRREASIAAADVPFGAADLDLPADIPSEIALRERSLYRAEIGSMAAQLAHIDAQLAQKTIDRQRLENVIAAQQELIAVMRERVDMRNSLVPSGAGTKASLIDAQESMRYQTTVLVGYEGDFRSTTQTLHVLQAERTKLISAFVAEQGSKRIEALRQVDELSQRLARNEARLARMVIRSPSAGFVHGLSVQSPGQVVGAGQEIGRIVPADGQLEIEVYLPNKDIGFVQEGQDVAIKLDAFPFTRYGLISAHVTRIGRDAIPEPDARQAEADGVVRSNDARATAGGQRMQNLVFPVIVAPTQASIHVDERDVLLAPGMAVTAEIKTGKRKLIDYFLSPVRSDAGDAFRER